MQDLNIAYLQTALHWEDSTANHKHFDVLLEQQKQHNHLIVLPETFTTGFPVDPHVFAEAIDGPSVQWMREKATQFQSVICGSLLISEGGKYYNCLVWMRPDGSFERYHKRHVFRMGGEHERIEAGDALLHVELNGWKIRPLICYDLRFPVWSRNKVEQGVFDYDLLIYVANWPKVRAWPWKQLLIARAIENQAYVLGVNRVGKDGLGFDYNGDSALLDAKGMYVSQAYAEKECLVETTANHAELLVFRDKFNTSLDWDGFNILHLPVDS